jgi:nicotinamidase-related amidase
MAETAGEHLVVMDMQDYFLKDKPSDEVAFVIAQINDIIYSFREFGLPITFCVADPLYFGHTSEAIDCRDGDIVIPKAQNNAFTSHAFVRRVEQSRRLVITGCKLEFCVRETAAHAVNLGFEVIIPKDAVLASDVMLINKLTTKLAFLLRGIRYVNHHEM